MSWLQESSTYQAILAEGRAEGVEQGRAEGVAQGVALGEARGRVDQARRFILDLGTEKFGEPDPTVRAAFDSLNDLAYLERLHRRILTASSWAELLATPADR